MWNWIVIVVCYGFAALFLRLIGGFNAAGDAIANWGRRSSTRRFRRQGVTPSTYAKSRLKR
ncbi:MAG TPA: hypothetical protein VGJ34_05045 [Gaiellaceae bacterium]